MLFRRVFSTLFRISSIISLCKKCGWFYTNLRDYKQFTYVGSQTVHIFNHIVGPLHIKIDGGVHDIYIYIYIYMCVCVCVCVCIMWCFDNSIWWLSDIGILMAAGFSILANFNNTVVQWLQIRPLIFDSSSPLFKPLETVLSASIRIGITVIFMFHSFLSLLIRSKYLSLFLFSLIFALVSTEIEKSSLRQILFFFLD